MCVNVFIYILRYLEKNELKWKKFHFTLKHMNKLVFSCLTCSFSSPLLTHTHTHTYMCVCARARDLGRCSWNHCTDCVYILHAIGAYIYIIYTLYTHMAGCNDMGSFFLSRTHKVSQLSAYTSLPFKLQYSLSGLFSSSEPSILPLGWISRWYLVAQ